MTRDAFNFRCLNDVQKSAVYSKLQFIEKFDLRKVSKIFTKHSTHQFTMTTRFSEMAVHFDSICSNSADIFDSEDGRSEFWLRINEKCPTLELAYLDTLDTLSGLSGRCYVVKVPISTSEFLFDFLNRFLRVLPAQGCDFSEDYCRENAPRYAALDIWQGTFSTSLTISCVGDSAMCQRLRESRERPRQPDRIDLRFGDDPWSKEVLEQTLHVPKIGFHFVYRSVGGWGQAMDSLMALLEALLITYLPADDTARLFYHSLGFEMPLPDEMAVVFRLPERLLAYLERADIRSRGDVQIFSHDGLTYYSRETQKYRWREVRFLVTIAQNYGNRRGQLYAEQRHRAEPDFNEYTLEWSSY